MPEQFYDLPSVEEIRQYLKELYPPLPRRKPLWYEQAIPAALGIGAALLGPDRPIAYGLAGGAGQYLAGLEARRAEELELEKARQSAALKLLEEIMSGRTETFKTQVKLLEEQAKIEKEQAKEMLDWYEEKVPKFWEYPEYQEAYQKRYGISYPTKEIPTPVFSELEWEVPEFRFRRPGEEPHLTPVIPPSPPRWEIKERPLVPHIPPPTPRSDLEAYLSAVEEELGEPLSGTERVAAIERYKTLSGQPEELREALYQLQVRGKEFDEWIRKERLAIEQKEVTAKEAEKRRPTQNVITALRSKYTRLRDEDSADFVISQLIEGKIPGITKTMLVGVDFGEVRKFLLGLVKPPTKEEEKLLQRKKEKKSFQEKEEKLPQKRKKEEPPKGWTPLGK